GFVTGTANAPQITKRTGETLPTPITFDPQTGKFDVEVPVGNYVLVIRTPDAQGNLLTGELPMTVNSDVENLTLAAGSPMVLPIRVESRSTSTSDGVAPPQNSMIFEGFGPSVQIGGRGRRLRLPVVQVRLISSENRLEAEEFQADTNATDGS